MGNMITLILCSDLKKESAMLDFREFTHRGQVLTRES